MIEPQIWVCVLRCKPDLWHNRGNREFNLDVIRVRLDCILLWNFNSYQLEIIKISVAGKVSVGLQVVIDVGGDIVLVT